MSFLSQPGSDYQLTKISLDAGYVHDLILMLIDVHAVLDHLYLDSKHPRITSPAEPDGVTGGRMPNHCSAPQASNRSTSVNPSFAARRIERALAVWVKSTTGSPGSVSSSQPSAAAHASAAYPNPHACGRNR
jgi:hypothetical protein